MGQKQIGMKVVGGLFKSDGTDLNWDEFIDKVEEAGLEYTGYSSPIDDEGNEYKVIDSKTWELGAILKEGDEKTLEYKNERLRENVKFLKEQLDISQGLHRKEFDKCRRYENSLYALYQILLEQGQDGLVDIITDTLNGFDVTDKYGETSEKGKELFKQTKKGNRGV